MPNLPIEILCGIFGYLSESLADLSRLSRCSRRFNSVVGPLLYKNFYLSLYFLEEQEIVASLAALNGLGRSDGWGVYVETFTVSGMDAFGQWDPRSHLDTMEMLSIGILKALANMTRLKMFNWRIPSRFPAPEIIGILGMLSVARSLRDVNLGFERDNDEPAYNIPPDDEKGTGLIKLALGCRLPLPYAIDSLQAIISCSPDIKVLRITGELCVDLFLNQDPSTEPIRPTILEICDPYEHYSPVVFTSGLIDLSSCRSLTFNCEARHAWLSYMGISETRRSQPGFLTKLKVLRFTNSTDNLCCLEMLSFLGQLHGLEELWFAGRSIHNVDYPGGSGIGQLRAHVPTMRKLFISVRVPWQFFRLIPRYENLEDLAIELLDPTPLEDFSLALRQPGKLPKLKIFRIIVDTQSDTIQSLVLNRIKRQSRIPSRWPALRFLCGLDNDERFITGDSDLEDLDVSEASMTVWERIRHDDGDMLWSGPVHVAGRVLVTEDWRTGGLARHDDWDEWLRKKCAESDA